MSDGGGVGVYSEGSFDPSSLPPPPPPPPSTPGAAPRVCPHCGAAVVPDDAKFCAQCGTFVASPTPADGAGRAGDGADGADAPAGRWVASSLPATVLNPYEWDEIAHAISAQTSHPPSTDLKGLTAFTADAVQRLIEADTTRNAEVLRGRFADPVIAQLMQYSGRLAGCAPRAVDLTLIGLRGGDPPVIRCRVQLTLSEPWHELSRREHFWDVALGATALVASTTCPYCQTQLLAGSPVCPNCHTDTRFEQRVPLLVVKLQRMS